jgi:bifunctional UDP-N-acetylglucosamine pyrophosphorylase/glucosamine-1-phosphate N-acetyltransferase
MKPPLSVLILAAGEGTRMKSALPKVLHRLAGKPLLEHVLTTVRALKPRDVAVVLGFGRAEVKQTLDADGWKGLSIIVQAKPQGSGHAVLQARSWLSRRKGTLLVVYGDTPLLTAATLGQLVQAHAGSGNAATFLAMDLKDPSGYGRMITRGENQLDRIVEDRDASESEKRVTLVNSGVACWDIGLLTRVLPKLRPNNVKHEYYLTDAVALLRADGHSVGVVTVNDPNETHGINTRIDLAESEGIFRRRILDHWMREGVTILDPATTYIEATAVLTRDTRIWPGTVIRGDSRIGTGCEIGPYTIIEGAIVKDGARVGPFARIRPGTVIDENVHVGNFVEVKKSRLGKGSKVNHLTYIGDATIGARVNVGAGTITCNYDGVAKHPTIIGDDVFIGSNANLVAPVRIGSGAMIGAGSTITKNVPPDGLAVARASQVVKPRWVKSWFNKRKRGSK